MGRPRQRVENVKKHLTKEEKDIRLRQEEHLKKLSDDKVKPLPVLSKRGKRIFKDIENELSPIAMICNVDSYGLSVLSDTIDTYIEATIAKNTNPLTSLETNKNGNTREVPNVYLKIQRDCTEIIRRYSTEFGLTPASRQKIIEINIAPIDEDEIEIREKFGDI